MYEKLLELYIQGRITDLGLDRAVNKGWITAEQAEEIKVEVQAILNDNKTTEE